MKAKTRLKKLSSLLLVVVMLLGIIPMGAIGVYAEETILYPDDGSLTIDASATEYVIKGPDDWATVSAASSTNNFAGKKVTLGVDLGRAEAPLTLDTLFTNAFLGEFNGNGKIISNVTVNGVALIAAKTQGVGVSIHDFTVKNSSVTATHNDGTAFIVAAVNAATDDDMTTIKNVIVEGCTVTGGAHTAVGALVGRTTGTYYVGLNIDSCKVTKTAVTTDGSETGLMIGKTVGGVVNVTNCEVDGTVNATTDLNKVGGMIGYAEAEGNRYLALTVSNTSVNVALSSTAGSGNTLSATGVMIGLLATGGWSNTANVGTTAILVEGCTVGGSITAPTSGIGGVAGIVKLPNNDDYSFTVRNTDVDVDLTAKGTTANSHFAGMGSVVGSMIANMASYTAADCKKITQGSVLFENLTVEGTLAPVYTVGGVIGSMFGGALDTACGFGTDVVISKCDIHPTITGGTGISRGGIVGLFGGYGWVRDSVTMQMYYTGLFDVVESVIGVAVTEMGGTLGTDTYTTGLVIGLGAFHGATVNVQNCAVVPVFDAGVVNTINGVYPAVSLIVGRLRPQYDKNAPTDIRVQNCVTNVTGTPGTDFWVIGNSSNVKLNGLSAPDSKPYSDDSLCQMTDAQINAMINRDDNGDILSIGGVLAGGYVQYTKAYTVTPEGGSEYQAYAIRFIALSQLKAPKNAGFKVVAKDAKGNTVAVFDTLECVAYDSLIGYAPSGEALPAYTATAYGASKFLAIVIEDIPTGAAYNFEVTPHYETEGGVTIYGETRVAEFDADGELANAIN